jgi:hypothetical protein
MEYFYVTAPENHHDLADCFGGVYDKTAKTWRFDISQKEDVQNFLTCSEEESTDEEDVMDYLNKYTENRPERSRSVHRARSACAENSSDSSLDSDSEIEKSNTSPPCEISEKHQIARQKKVQELKDLIK